MPLPVPRTLKLTRPDHARDLGEEARQNEKHLATKSNAMMDVFSVSKTKRTIGSVERTALNSIHSVRDSTPVVSIFLRRGDQDS